MSRDLNKTTLTITNNVSLLDKACPFRPAGHNCGDWCPHFYFHDSEDPQVSLSCGNGVFRNVTVVRNDS